MPTTMPLTEEQRRLAEQWQTLPYHCLKRFPRLTMCLGRDEFLGVASLALVEAVRSGTRATVKDFAPFAICCIYRALVVAATRDGLVRRKSGGRYGHPPIKVVHAGQVDEPDPDRDSWLASLVWMPPEIDRVDARLDAETLLAHLPPRWRWILQDTVLGDVDDREVAAELGVTRQRVTRLRAKALAWLRQRSKEGEAC